MVDLQHENRPLEISDRNASGADSGPTLVPMLVYELLLITIGMIVLMMFV